MSNALKLLQTKCGCDADGSFGPNTARGIVKHYELSPERGAHLLGQIVHESASFKLTRENLNYSVEAMMRVGQADSQLRKVQNHMLRIQKH